MNCSVEDYTDSLIALNRNLRDQLELLYKLMAKKIVIDKDKDCSHSNRLIQLISELEALKSNLSVQMKGHTEVVIALKEAASSKAQYEMAIEEHKLTIEGFHSQVEDISNENIVLNNQLVAMQKENTKLLSQFSECTTNQKKLIESNAQLAKENAKLKEDKLQLTAEVSSNEMTIEEMNSKIEDLGNDMKALEEKYKKKLLQKNLIIQTIDKKLQEYEQEKHGQVDNEEPEDNDND